MLSSIVTSSMSGATGLHNKGATCYLNSILQCLLNTVDLRTYVTYKNFIKEVIDVVGKEKNKDRQNFLSYHLSVLFNELWYKTHVVCDPKSLVNFWTMRHKEYKIGAQHDAHEALKTILDDFHMELCREVKITYPNLRKDIRDLMSLRDDYIYLMKNEPEKEKKIELARLKYETYKKEHPDKALKFKSYKAWSDYIRNSKCSKITELFDNIILSCITCPDCKSESYTFDAQRFLIVPLPSKDTTLYSCLYNLSYPEILAASESYKCSHCNKKVLYAKKYTTIWEPSKILVILLQRFKSNGITYVKNGINVSYPLELNVSSFLSPKVKDEKEFKYENYNYSLYAVSNHHGHINGGHYTSFAKNSIDNKWRFYNDTYVTEISDPLKNSDAYILFYEFNEK